MDKIIDKIKDKIIINYHIMSNKIFNESKRYDKLS